MRRRDFIRGVLGSAASWPLAARAQQPDTCAPHRRLMAYAEDNPDGKPRLAAFAQRLQELGWTDGRNIRVEYRWSAGDAERTRKYAAELVALAPDIILAGNTSTVGPLQQATRTVPIVFAGVVDPVGAGFVDKLGTPGRQYYRLHAVRIRYEQQMARIAQRGRAPRDAGSGNS